MLLVVLLTLNAFVLHRLTFPRLARGRRVARWHAADWVMVAVPVGISNFLWMFSAFLGIARPWNYTMPLRDILEIAAALYVVAQCGVFAVLAIASRGIEPDRKRFTDLLTRSLASVGSLGRPAPAEAEAASRRPRRSRWSRAPVEAMSEPQGPGATAEAALTGRPALRLVDTGAAPLTARRRTR